MWYKYRKYKYKKGGKMETSLCGVFALVLAVAVGAAVTRYIKHLQELLEENERDRETWSPPEE